MNSNFQKITENDLKGFDSLEKFTIRCAAFLWAGYKPPNHCIFPESNPKVAGKFQKIAEIGESSRLPTEIFLKEEELKSLKDCNHYPIEVTREELKRYAEKKGLKPLFLYPEERERKRAEIADGQTSENETEKYVFREDGKFWKIVFEGKSLPPLQLKGFKHFYDLIKADGERIHAFDLMTSATGYNPYNASRIGQTDEDGYTEDGLRVSKAMEGGYQEISDIETIKSFKAEKRRLENDLERAKESNDPDEGLIQRDIDRLDDEIYKAYTPDGNKKTFDTNAEKARKAVRKNMNTAYNRMNNGNLERHLRTSIKPDGKYWYYDPSEKIPWKLQTLSS